MAEKIFLLEDDAYLRDGLLEMLQGRDYEVESAESIKKAEIIAYEDLGTEAIRKLEVEKLPAIVVIDSKGNNLYETATKQYCR